MARARCFTIVLALPQLLAQTVIFHEDFSDVSDITVSARDGSSTATGNSAFFGASCSSGDYLGVQNGAGSSCFGSSDCTDGEESLYAADNSGMTKPYLVAEDMDGTSSNPCGPDDEMTLTWPAIDVSVRR